MSEAVTIIITRPPATKVNVQSAAPATVNVRGTAGIPGPKGDKGDKGDPGDGTGLSFVHTQGVASDTWTVSHNLGYYPNVTVVDSAKREVVGDVEYINTNTIQITFSSGFSGEAYCS
jgi:hypothetical protein